MYIRREGSSILTPYRPEMLKKILYVASVLAVARAQIPSLGWCPEYVPMSNFDMGKFLGVWHEAERYFQLSEVVSRCVMANYTQGADGKLRVSNEVTNRFTGIKRVLEGEIKAPASKAEEGKLHVKYTTVPLTPETQYAVLETDYKNYAVLWSCNGIGPIHAQNAWLMTRSRRPSGEILQQAYGVLDKYKISKTFFVKTDQDDCAHLDGIADIAKPIAKPTEKPVVEEATEEEAVEEAQAAKSGFNLRTAIFPDAPAIIIQTRKAEIAAAEKLAAEAKPEAESEEAKPEVLSVEPVVAAEEPIVEKAAEVAAPPVSVPEVILKTADLAKETVKETAMEEPKVDEPIEKISEKAADSTAAETQEATEKPLEPEKPKRPILDALSNTYNKTVTQLQENWSNGVQQFQAAIPSKNPLEQLQSFAQNTYNSLPKPGDLFQNGVDRLPQIVKDPVQTFISNAQQFQATFQQKPVPAKPVEQADEPAKEPAKEAAKEAAVNEPAAVVAEAKPEAIKEQEAPKEDEKPQEEKKIES